MKFRNTGYSLFASYPLPTNFLPTAVFTLVNSNVDSLVPSYMDLHVHLLSILFYVDVFHAHDEAVVVSLP